MTPDLIERVWEGFRRHSGRAPGQACFAPGRVNLIGEHTDYNGGFVLPCAIEAGTVVAYAPREDNVVRVVALDEPGEPVDRFSTTQLPTRGVQGHWANHVRGVVACLLKDGRMQRGADLAVAGSVPRGAGLSSSASLGVALALCLEGKLPEPLEVARTAQWSEHHYVGCQCGIMDPLVVAAATAGCAMLIDCREPTWRSVVVPGSVGILVAHSGVTRELASGAYNRRRQECETAARQLGIASLREADLAMLDGAAPCLDEVARRRARHVVSENVRALAAAEALADGDLRQLGALLRGSHASLRDDFEVTVPAIDALVDRLNATIMAELDGLGGARMTGGGFGGCVVALVHRDGIALLERVTREVLEAAGVERPLVFQSRPGPGTQRLTLS